MQKLFICLLGMTLLGSSLHAQDKFRVGILLSPIISTIRVSDSVGNDFDGDSNGKFGFAYGLMLNWDAGENFGFHSGARIVHKHFKVEQDIQINGSAPRSEQKVRINTLEIPAAIFGRSNEIGDGYRIIGQFGVSFNFTIGYKNEWDNVNPVTLETGGSGTLRDSDRVDSFVMDFVFGVGGEKTFVDVGTVSAGIFYHQALNDINNDNNPGINNELRLSYFSFDLSYYFN
ncbi:hypothetical protein [Pontibacter sp. G13]|uniref:hypothetical protein n=1 Tax=Pontibacter sp. G13 TaxID=3074898 RepID=UPI00288A24EA|nr:hypothetical protein [Pontibacter sp. G13]WNJ17380.1 hypothetical protein RJD25_21225 [Pontibacter sp. G13]